MDTFEALILEMKKLPAEERDLMMQEKMTHCICPQCPTYTSCSINEQEKAFCLVGNSFQCISFEKGCICKDCSLYKESGFKHKKFCTQGDEKGQRYAESWVTA